MMARIVAVAESQAQFVACGWVCYKTCVPTRLLHRKFTGNNTMQYPKLDSLSVFYPAYNDEGSIRPLVKKTLDLLPTLTNDFEIIVVNDGSSDNTAAILDEMARTLPHVRVIHHPKNRGYGGALRTGILNTTKEWVFYTDGDAQYDVNELRDLVALVRDDLEVVNGYKRKRSDNRRRIILGGIYKRLSRLLPCP